MLENGAHILQFLEYQVCYLVESLSAIHIPCQRIIGRPILFFIMQHIL